MESGKYLIHQGVKGMKWGVRKNNSKSSYKQSYKTGNLDKFGTKGHNILFVTGLSGSGKSTFSLDLAKKTNSEIIHLDTYFEKRGVGNNKQFNKFLDSHGVNKSTMFKPDGKLEYSISDKVLPLLKKYNKKVIVEGVQLMDTTLSDNTRGFLKNEPCISLMTSKTISINRAENRDGSYGDPKELIAKYERTSKLKTEMEQELNLAIGKYSIEQMLGK